MTVRNWMICLKRALATGLIVWVGGCNKGEQPAAAAKMPAPEVTVAVAVEQQVTDYETFQGRTEPMEEVEVRARVSGYLVKADFTPGIEVQKGKLLFEIDPRPYQADLDRAEAAVKQAEAREKRLTTELERSQKLREKGMVSVEDFEKAVGDKAEASAAVIAAKANVGGNRLNLQFTKIECPITGKIGDRLVDVGNLVMGGQGATTLLTTIVSVDPIAVGFDVNENTFLRVQQAVREGRIGEMKAGEIPVELGLNLHGTDYPIRGVIDFVNNRIDPKTGTIRLKAQFKNPKPSRGERVLASGIFVRLRVPIGQPRKAQLVPDSALGSDQGRKFLYTVNDKNEAVRLESTTGILQNGLRVIESVQSLADKSPRPLRADEKIIIRGIQRVLPGAVVVPKQSDQKS